jgi:hypothetical protein
VRETGAPSVCGNWRRVRACTPFQFPRACAHKCMRMSERETWCVVLAWLVGKMRPDAGVVSVLHAHTCMHRCVRRRGHCTCGYAGTIVSRCSQLRFRLLGLGAKGFAYAHARVPLTHTPHTLLPLHRTGGDGQEEFSAGLQYPVARASACGQRCLHHGSLCLFYLVCESEKEAGGARAR